MFPAASLLSTLFLALSIAASPVVLDKPLVSLPLARSLSGNGTFNVVEWDRARLAGFRARSEARATGDWETYKKRSGVYSTDITNGDVIYTASVGIGSPATDYKLIVDTGSSNTWIGAGTAYVETSTSVETSYDFSVDYGSGEVKGDEWLDTVTLGTNLVITSQSIGVATRAEGFTGYDGILGIGPLDLTVGTLTNDRDASIPTVTENLYSQGTIPTTLVAIFFEPASTGTVSGELTFGGTDSTQYTGDITYTTLTTTEDASLYWGISQSVTYGTTTILSTTTGFVDTGTQLLYFDSTGYSAYVKATGATEDRDTGLLTVTSTQYDDLEDLNFLIGGTTFSLTANAQIWPRSLNSYIGGSSSTIYLITLEGDLPTGVNFVNGYTFLERFYSVFDTTNNRVGLATTSYTDATTN